MQDQSINKQREEGAGSFWAGRRVAVTGATGFLGYHVALQLAAGGAQVTALVRPDANRGRLLASGIGCREATLDDGEALASGLDGCELLFHLAAAVDFEGDWERFRRVNLEGTRNLVAAAGSVGIRRLVHTSSIVAVGATRQPVIMNETTAWNLGELAVPYVTTKREAEELVLSAERGSLEVVVVNPTCVVGPEDYSSSEFGTLCRRFWKGRIPFYFCGGNNFVDVRDVAAGQLLAAEFGRSGERYILGGENLTYAKFFELLARVAHRRIFRLRVPCALGPLVAWLDGGRRSGKKSRSYLTAEQVRLLPLFFYADSGKADRELGFRVRPLLESVTDAHTFWMEGRNHRHLHA